MILASRFFATVVDNSSYGCATRIVVETPSSFYAEPGQFLHILCDNEGGRILRRPFSLFDARPGQASLLVRKVGPGSAWLAERGVGESLDCLGPLGRGFSFEKGGRYALLAGGAGIAPLAFLSRRMNYSNIESFLLWGMEKEDAYGELPEVLAAEVRGMIASRDGGAGFKGSVLEFFRTRDIEGIDAVYACGPRGMLVELAERISESPKVMLQVSLEEYMACGIGACKGCAVAGSSPAGGYLTVCKDGPVFEGKELDWQRIKART